LRRTETRVVSLALPVRDVAAAATFYRDAFGFAFDNVALSASVGVNLVPAGDVPSGTAELRLLAADLDAAHTRAVAAGADVVDAPSGARGRRAAVYRDPDGNVIRVTEGVAGLRAAGVDLARGALAVVVLEENRVVDSFRCESFADALLVDAEVIGVDLPIGIPDDGQRPADIAARRFVGPRASSVFATPLRPILEAETYEQARIVATELTGKSISAQSYALRRRILELDDYASADQRVIEVHPEVSFRELARGPLLSKHRTDGLVQRRLLLQQAGIGVPTSVPRVAEPDLLDATVVAWSAARYARGEALPLPEGKTERIGAIWR
jgi:predicted RNase H-like nuclease/predicted enzyme related to lactoylglutathione lyase